MTAVQGALGEESVIFVIEKESINEREEVCVCVRVCGERERTKGGLGLLADCPRRTDSWHRCNTVVSRVKISPPLL